MEQNKVFNNDGAYRPYRERMFFLIYGAESIEYPDGIKCILPPTSHHKQKSVMSELIEMWNVKQYTSGKCCLIEICESHIKLILSYILMAYIHDLIISTYSHLRKNEMCILASKQIFQNFVCISHFWHIWVSISLISSAQ